MEKHFIRIGVIGCGIIAQSDHLPAMLRLPNCRLVAVADTHEERARRAAEVFGAKRWLTDYQELLALDEVEAVDICTHHYPVDMHYPVGMAAAAAGKHILVEKPMCNRLEDGRRLVQACNAAGVKLMVAYPHRFDAEAQRARKIIQEGLLGEIVGVQSLFSIGEHDQPVRRRLDDWFPDLEPTEPIERPQVENPDPDMNGGHFLHHLNLIRYLLGDPESVLSASYERGMAAEMHMALQYPNRSVVVHQALGNTGNTIARLLVFGTQGHLEIQLTKPHFPYISPGLWLGRPKEVAGEKSLTIEQIIVRHCDSFEKEIEHFADCVRYDREPISTGEDAVRDLEIVDTTLRSWKEGRRLQIQYEPV